MSDIPKREESYTLGAGVVGEFAHSVCNKCRLQPIKNSSCFHVDFAVTSQPPQYENLMYCKNFMRKQ